MSFISSRNCDYHLQFAVASLYKKRLLLRSTVQYYYQEDIRYEDHVPGCEQFCRRNCLVAKCQSRILSTRFHQSCTTDRNNKSEYCKSSIELQK